MARKYTKEESKKLFREFDNGNGVLSLAEVDRAIIHFHPEFGTNRQAILRAFKAADTNGSGFVEFKEFHHLLDLLYYYQELGGLFTQLDTNHDKRVSLSEFKKGHELMGLPDGDDNQLKREFNSIDTNHGGFILFDEFCMHMAKKKLHH